MQVLTELPITTLFRTPIRCETPIDFAQLTGDVLEGFSEPSRLVKKRLAQVQATSRGSPRRCFDRHRCFNDRSSFMGRHNLKPSVHVYRVVAHEGQSHALPLLRVHASSTVVDLQHASSLTDPQFDM